MVNFIKFLFLFLVIKSILGKIAVAQSNVLQLNTNLLDTVVLGKCTDANISNAALAMIYNLKLDKNNWNQAECTYSDELYMLNNKIYLWSWKAHVGADTRPSYQISKIFTFLRSNQSSANSRLMSELKSPLTRVWLVRGDSIKGYSLKRIWRWHSNDKIETKLFSACRLAVHYRLNLLAPKNAK
jgi:hypothetical protein